MSEPQWLLYGAYGYTGHLIARRAVEEGHAPLLAGRNEERLRAVGDELGLEWVRAEIGELTDVLGRFPERAATLVNAAGPFTATAERVLDACLERGMHYLDVTGEVRVLEELFRKDAQARHRGITAVPAVGFDVVPSDSLALRLHEKVRAGLRLELAFRTPPGSSRGTLKTILTHLPAGGLQRRGGVLIRGHLGEGGRSVPFPDRDRYCVPVPWGDLVTAYRTTGIPDVVTYMAMSPSRARNLRILASTMGRLLTIPRLRRWAFHAVDALNPSPEKKRRHDARSMIWGRVESPDGRAAWGAVETMEGYGFTAAAVLRALERLRTGGTEAGVLTPTQAFGVDFVEEVPGTKIQGPLMEGAPRAHQE